MHNKNVFGVSFLSIIYHKTTSITFKLTMAHLVGFLVVLILSITCSNCVLPNHFKTDHNSVNPASVDPEILQYLTRLFENVKESGRQPVQEEFNLLPDESTGFANMVRCFPDSALDPVSSSVRGNKREMQFDLHGFKSTEEIVEVRLVLKQAANAPEYTASVHEITADGKGLQELDSHVYHGEWLDLKVHTVNDHSPIMTELNGEYNQRSYRLALKISDVSNTLNCSETLNNLKPMLVIYTYDPKVLEHMTKGDNKTTSSSTKSTESTKESSEEETNHTLKKRNAGYTVVERPPTPFEELGKLSCRLQHRNVTYAEIGWPENHLNIIIIRPTTLNFSFCYGHCRAPFTRGEEHKYTGHAKLISILNNDLVEAGIAPCCVPTSFLPIDIVFEEYGLVSMTTFSDISACGCR